MATTTPNFGWPVPTSTDLVKNGATAIEALGDSIDASMLDLKGGTTGQVLSKTTNTDMDFTWVTTDDANAIQNSIVDAKGDLIAASAADTPARLAVGSNGETLVAYSSTSTGLRWQGSQAAGKNGVINGGFDIWQRGTSSTLNVGYGSADRWYQFIGAGTGTYARESTVIPLGSQYSMKFTASSAGTSHSLSQYFETATEASFINRTVTVSAQVAASTSTAMSITVATSTTVDAGAGATWTTVTATSGGTATPTSTTFVNLTGVYAIPSTAQSIRLTVGPTSTTANGVVIYYGNVQLELGSVPTTFTRAGGTIQGELAACTYYFERLAAESTTNGAATFAYGLAISTTQVIAQLKPFARKRIVPTITFSGNTDFRVFDQVTATATTSIGNVAASSIDVQGFGVASISAVVGSGLTQYRPYFVIPAGGTGTRYIDISSEL